MRPLRNWTVFWEFSSDSLRTRELALSQRWFEEGQVYFHFHFWKMHRTHIHWRLPLPSFQPLYSVISHFNPLPRTRRQTGTVEHRFLFVSHKTWCPSKNVFSLSSKSKKWEREREREREKRPSLSFSLLLHHHLHLLLQLPLSSTFEQHQARIIPLLYSFFP